MFVLIWSNLFRRPLRAALTILSLTIAFLMYLLLVSLGDAVQGEGNMHGNRLLVVPKYALVEGLPIRYADELQRLPGVEAVTHMSWFDGTFQRLGNTIPAFAVMPTAYFELFPNFSIDPAVLGVLESTQTGAVAPRVMATKQGWRTGDKVPVAGDLRRDGGRVWEFDIVGTYSANAGGAEPSELLFNYRYFDATRAFGNGTVGWFNVLVTNTQGMAEIAAAIDERFANSPNPTLTATASEWQRRMANEIGDINLIITSIMGAVFFTVLLVTANTMVQAIREREPDFAVLKTLGFTELQVFNLALAESVLVSLLGWLGGAILGASILLGFSPVVEPIVGRVEILGSTLLSSAAIALGLAFIVGVIPAANMRRTSIVGALQRH